MTDSMNNSINLFDQNPSPENSREDYIVGEVESIFFSAPDSFFKIMRVKIKESSLTSWNDDYITVTGDFADIKEGIAYRFSGKLVKHPKYGLQFKALKYENETVTTTEGLVTYLSGDDFPGVGKKTAEKVVSVLGKNAISILLNNPPAKEDLGISERQRKVLLAGVKENNGAEQVIIGLNGYGFSSSLAAKIYAKYGSDSLDTIRQNPYQLAIDINGIGFARADQLAEKMGFATDSEGRIQAGIMHSLRELCLADGNTYTTSEPLLDQSLSLLEKGRNEQVDPDQVATQMIELANQGKVLVDKGKIYFPAYYYAEKDIADELYRIVNDNQAEHFPEEKIKQALDKTARQLNISYGADQQEAIQKAIQNKVFLLTGGPGTGKTTIINGIVSLFAQVNGFSLDPGEYAGTKKNYPVLLAAPTGRAAKRMSETTGLPASTIHRLLGINQHDEVPQEDKQLEGQLLIIDEASMVDTTLMKYLLKSIPSGMHLILVGDKDQLPSVGPGQVFSDLIASGAFPTVKLEKIYRQDEDSTITVLAHSIKQGKLPADFTAHMPDRSFIPCSGNQVAEVVKKIVLIAQKKGNNLDQLQVLVPMYRGAAGIDNLNTVLQAIINPEKKNSKFLISGKNKFLIGDRVLHLVNDPEHNIFNGDLGKVVGIDDGKTKKGAKGNAKMTVDFDGNEVDFYQRDLNRLTLAYCMSIHKAQGSEFPIVILPMVRQYVRMFARNLLYTGITRAEDKLVLLGEVKAFRDNVIRDASVRKTSLKQRIQQVFEIAEDQDAGPAENNDEDGKKLRESQVKEQSNDYQTSNDEEPVLTMAKIQSRRIDPMIGMKGISPYDFMK